MRTNWRKTALACVLAVGGIMAFGASSANAAYRCGYHSGCYSSCCYTPPCYTPPCCTTTCYTPSYCCTKYVCQKYYCGCGWCTVCVYSCYGDAMTWYDRQGPGTRILEK